MILFGGGSAAEPEHGSSSFISIPRVCEPREQQKGFLLCAIQLMQGGGGSGGGWCCYVYVIRAHVRIPSTMLNNNMTLIKHFFSINA